MWRCVGAATNIPVLILLMSWAIFIYAVPFEEDPRNSKIWFVDHNYHENMFAMFKKVNGTYSLLFIYYFQRL